MNTGMDKYKKLSKNTFIFAAANIGAKIVNFLLVPLYTNVLTRAQYGTAELVLNCTSIMIPIASLSISDALLRFGLDKEINENTVLKNSAIVLLFGTVFCMALTPVYSLYSGIGTWALWFSLLCVSQMVRNTLTLFAKTLQNNKLFAIDTIIYTLALGISNVILLAVLNTGISGYFLSIIIANLISILFLGINEKVVFRIKSAKYDKKIFSDMLKFCVPMIANALSWWIIHFSDRVMLEQMMTVEEVGLYSAAAKIPNIVSTVLAVFTQAWTISSVLEYDDERDERFYSNVFSFYLFLLSFMCSAFLLIIKPFMQVYVGSNFTVSWVYVPLLIAATLFGAIATFIGPIYSAAKKNVAATLTTVFGGIINILFNFFLIKRYGIIGAVIATLIANMTMGIVRLYDSRRFFKFEIDQQKLWLVFIIILIQSTVVTIDRFSVGISLLSLLLIILINRKICSKFFKTVLEMVRKKR